MNWLAHIYLSDPDPAARVGNMLPDLVPMNALASLPSGLQRGVAQHRRVDAFTDAHPIVRRSISRFAPPFRRFGGILTDLFYDHFLARDWRHFVVQPLEQFVGDVYAAFPTFREQMPALAYERLEQIRTADWLCSYGTVAGIAKALDRIGGRFSRPVNLSGAIRILEDKYEAFGADFVAFLPEVRAHVR